MSVMSAAVKRAGEVGGRSAGSGPEFSPRGQRMASSVSDPDDTGAGPGSPGGRPAQPGPSPAAGHDRRLRLVTTEVHVRKVRVAREVSAASVPATRLGAGGQQSGWPGAGVPRAGWPGAGVPGAGAGGVPRAGWPGGDAPRAAGPEAGAPGVSARSASVLRASAVRVAAPGVSAHRVRVQRASAGRISVRGAAVRPGALRLTRRGRRVLTGLVMLVAIIAAMLIWTSVAGGAQVPGAGSPARSPYQGMTQIVVQPGQTLWSVAAAAEPSADPWTVIQQISDVNALNGAQIRAGQLLWVPRG